MDEVDAVPGAMVDSKLADAFPYRLHIPRIAKGKSANADGDLRSGLTVAEIEQPN